MGGEGYWAEWYADEVLEGRVDAPRNVRLACERHRRDLAEGKARGLYFDAEAAGIVIDFLQVLNHWEGEWAGERFLLEPWQQFIIWSLFGWKRADGSRRFRTGYIEVPRKNGKTTLAAGVGLYLAFVDQEPGAQVYSAATKRDQARINHKAATEMLKRCRPLKRMVRSFKDNLNMESTASKYEPLSADYNSLDGLNVHGVIADELHAWRDRGLWDVLQKATGSRRQSLMMPITTAGTDQLSLCFEFHSYTEQVNEGVIEDDSWFGVIYSAELDDDGALDWEDEATWYKANPGLEVSKKIETMREDADKARAMPSELNSFLRYHLNIWTRAETRWISPERWAACGRWEVDEDMLAGRSCYGGLDLASVSDLNALALVFPPERADEPFQVVMRFWVPEDNIGERIRLHRVPYDTWARAGLLQLMPGNIRDDDFILAEIGRLRSKFKIEEIAFDRWGAVHISQRLTAMGGEDWMVQFGQGFASMAAPMRELERLILGTRLAHGNHAVLTWNAANLVAVSDPAGNLKPDKSKSREKIDGMTGLVMAIDRATREGRVKQAYRDRGMVFVG